MRFGSDAWGGQDAWALTASPAPQSGETPLHEAAVKGHAAVVEQLLAAGAAKDAENRVRREAMGALGMQDREGSDATFPTHVKYEIPFRSPPRPHTKFLAPLNHTTCHQHCGHSVPLRTKQPFTSNR